MIRRTTKSKQSRSKPSGRVAKNRGAPRPSSKSNRPSKSTKVGATKERSGKSRLADRSGPPRSFSGPRPDGGKSRELRDADSTRADRARHHRNQSPRAVSADRAEAYDHDHGGLSTSRYGEMAKSRDVRRESVRVTNAGADRLGKTRMTRPARGPIFRRR